MPYKSDQKTINDLHILKRMRKNILQSAYLSKDGHIPSSFSILECLYCIFIKYPQITGKKFLRDFDFILSKGHASMALYAILQEISLINDSWITDFSKFESRFGGHPDRNKVQGVTASTGSLGHGLSIAVGLALANQNLNQKKLVFCLVGDGEMNEGSIWESLLVATHHNLSNLTIIIDNNQSSTRALKLPNIGKVLKDMEFNVYEVDGHNLKKILTAISISNINLKPKIIIANTIKGFGIPQLENNPAWHHLSPSESEYVQMVQDLK